MDLLTAPAHPFELDPELDPSYEPLLPAEDDIALAMIRARGEALLAQAVHALITPEESSFSNWSCSMPAKTMTSRSVRQKKHAAPPPTVAYSTLP